MCFINAWFDHNIIMQMGMKTVRVKLLIIEHFPIFSQFLNQMEFVIGCTNWKVTNVFGMLEVKEQRVKHKKRMSDNLF